MTPPPAVKVAPSDAVRIRVPATSANIGPGYDCLGLALGRYDEVIARRIEGPPRIEVIGCGAGTVPTTPEHLVYRSAVLGFEALGVAPPSLELLCRNEIPHGGGQGSSAAAIVAGLAVARELTADGRTLMPDSELLDIASRVEGHPDNAAPAVLGGFTLAWMDAAGHTTVVRRPVHPTIRVLMFSSLHGASTEKARAMLPASVPHAEAVANTVSAALLVHAVSDDPSLLFVATDDYLHQQYRAAAMPATATLVADLREAGVAAVVSGAGPSVLALVTGDLDVAAFRRPGFEPVELAVDRTGLVAGPVDGN